MQTERKEICNCGHCVERNLRYISEVPTIRIFFCNSHILGLPGICSFICFPLLLSFTKPKNHQTVLLSWDIAFNWFQSRHNCIYLECQKLKKGEFFFCFCSFFFRWDCNNYLKTRFKHNSSQLCLVDLPRFSYQY